MPQPYTAVPGGADASPPLGAPHTPPLGHAPPEFDSPGDDGDLGLPVAHSQQSRLSAFSSASAYAPLEGGQAAMPGRLPRPHSFASSHMLGAGSDYDSTYRLADFGRSTPGLSTPGEEHAMYEKGGAGAYAPVAAPLASDPRAAGRRRYGVAGQKGSARRRWCILLAVVLGLGIILVAVLVPLTQTLLKDDAPGSSGGSHGGGSNTGDQGTTVADGTGHGAGGRVLTEGGNGTVIELANGQSFTYINSALGAVRLGLMRGCADALCDRLRRLLAQRPAGQLGTRPVLHARAQRVVGLCSRSANGSESGRLAGSRAVHRASAVRAIREHEHASRRRVDALGAVAERGQARGELPEVSVGGGPMQHSG
jgi:hypothetical protein